MQNFYDVHSIENVHDFVGKALSLKQLAKGLSPKKEMQQGKTLAMLFFNSSLRTRMSTEIAAKKLGMDVITMDMNSVWGWEMKDGVTMNGKAAEHIKDAVKVICQFVDMIAIRCFPNLENAEEDYSDPIMAQFLKYASVPVINMESAILHPLQSLADMMTIDEHCKIKKPKIVLTWAPHIKVLPQCVSNSFLQWCHAADHEVVIANPEGFNLSPRFTQNFAITNNQEEAFEGADIIYCKNWSSYEDYGRTDSSLRSWMVDQQKMNLTNNGKFMHCMPIRRNVIATDKVLDSANNLMYHQAENRLHAAKYVIQNLLENE